MPQVRLPLGSAVGAPFLASLMSLGAAAPRKCSSSCFRVFWVDFQDVSEVRKVPLKADGHLG